MRSKSKSRAKRKEAQKRSRNRISGGFLAAACLVASSVAVYEPVPVPVQRFTTASIVWSPDPSENEPFVSPVPVLEPSLPTFVRLPEPVAVPAPAEDHRLRRRWMSQRIERQRNHVAALERLLLHDLEQSRTVDPSDPRYGLADRLWQLLFRADAEQSLYRYALGEPYMRSLNERLATLSGEDLTDDGSAVEPLMLYGNGSDGSDMVPTEEAVHAWEAMHHRLVRKTSALGKALPPFRSPAPASRRTT